VKGVAFDDDKFTLHWLEWLLMANELSYEKVYLYIYSAHAHIWTVLRSVLN